MTLKQKYEKEIARLGNKCLKSWEVCSKRSNEYHHAKKLYEHALKDYRGHDQKLLQKKLDVLDEVLKYGDL